VTNTEFTLFAPKPRASQAFVIGRSRANGTVRMMHMTRDYAFSICGYDLSGLGTRFFLDHPIYALLCKRCASTEAIEMPPS
jgi:hypothetical protein